MTAHRDEPRRLLEPIKPLVDNEFGPSWQHDVYRKVDEVIERVNELTRRIRAEA